MMRLDTARLIIRPWQEKDHAPWAAIQADRVVRRFYYPPVLTRAESDAEIDRCLHHLDRHGFGFLALERRDDHALIGGAGLSWTNDTPGAPAVELGWILAQPFWRQGYAREASLAWFAFGWAMGLEDIIGYTAALNQPSRALMESLGMRRNPADDFADPTVPADNPLSAHVLYRISRPLTA
ncbi:MAG: GNAT family N-acetyltransferase [Alphaproteobacteria bacterium]|nr:GNAT family N-acetyltransferase [Alphaproteobacteria bacterium]